MNGKFKRILLFTPASRSGLILLLVIMLSLPCRLFADVLDSSSSTSVVCPTTLKVILVQFNDVKWDEFWDGSDWQPFTYQHKMADFEALLTSLGSYSGENSDEDDVFGSFRDYFYENSRQSYSPTVNILNDTDGNGYPIWIDLPGDKSSYSSGSFISAANTAASNASLDISTSQSVRLCYIYAGNWVEDIGVFVLRLMAQEWRYRNASLAVRAMKMRIISLFIWDGLPTNLAT